MPVGSEISEDGDRIAATEVDEGGVTSVELEEPLHNRSGTSPS